MIVARFTPASAWAGRTIIYDNGQFALEGHGPVAGRDVLEYDRQGHLVWEYDGLREWVAQVSNGTAVLPTASVQYAVVDRLPSPPGIAIAGFVLAVAGFIIPVGVVWWVGLGLSWAGYAQATREKLPTGLALAGLIINAVMTAASIVFLVVLILLAAAS